MKLLKNGSFVLKESLSEGNTTKMMELWCEEVEGALTDFKIKEDTAMLPLFLTITPSHVNTKRTSTLKKNNHTPFCAFRESAGH
ncbi:hypothetical protein TNIN_499811 [Trichonephila inaurata madagascariensis]|uniref:Uncharacterized protein n=1 Tax=Trichonephila inaurata madagascariensis TaxID=2747483 RepID=A0A8X7BQB3_9ARAC|nr:hypothetical protein TNIN_499811 [Trichonephila inaurata madagascariensis]